MIFGSIKILLNIFCILGFVTLVLCVCPQGRYGDGCEYACHCPPGTECDPVTGQCPTGCAVGWSGAPYCQAVNVARGKKTYQHGTYLGWNSSRAVDGDPDQDGTYGSCAWAHNNDDVFKTWWNVDLGAAHYVQSVEIYFRTDDAMSESRRAGLRVYISETIEEAKNEGLCYMDQMADFVFPPSHLILREGSLGCSQRRGRFLIMYVDRPKQTPLRNCPTHTMYSCWANLELCEVEIYVCSNGTFGDMCQHRCHCHGDADAGCDAETGVCPGPCREGWQGPTCSQACVVGKYGIDCNMTCGHCLDAAKSCDRVSGTCASCQAGWRGERCDQQCPTGTYGLACTGQCGNCIGACDPQTGVCSLGCRPGWIGALCMEACAVGYYGPSCESPCSYCARDDVCDHVTGACPAGCEAGFTGSRCDKECPSGSYGPGCGEQCGQCRDDMPCNHLTGVCPTGCKNGWKGYTCKDECPPGSYGQQCSGECGICRKGVPCNHVTGLCTNGCSDGWIGEKCKNRCTPGHHGTNCIHVCGSCLRGEACDHVTGACLSGCNDGWRGDGCINTCQTAYYGVGCQKTCGHCKNQTACDHVTGLCAGGCQPEYYGEFCVLSLSIAGGGDKSDGSAVGSGTTNISVLIGGIMAGVVVVFAGIMIFVIFRRRRRNKPQPQRTGSTPKRTDTHTNVQILANNGEINLAGPTESPSPSRSSSHATNTTNCTQSHISVDDQEVLYVNLKKNKSPVPLPISVPSPNLSTFHKQLKVVPAGAGGPDEPTYYNTKDELSAPAAGGVPASEFHKYIKDMDNDKTIYKDQYSHYPHGMKYPHEAGKRPRNKFKNRFAQMFPYDHSRVILEEDATELDSDYINGNFIASVDYPNCYIATQGPNKITLKDFWRMVWQQKCGKIVMLTNLVEESKNKCERYWPNDRIPMTFGDLHVELTQTQEYPYYTLRIMRITHQTSQDDVREIKQFHFTAWPDHGVPDTFELVAFFKFVLRSEMTLPGPMVVHCSAGVGRTGTFIALDALYHYGKRGNNIDIPTFVHKMRQDRMNMIQTLDQYRLLHYALLEALGYGDTNLSKSAFRTECYRHLQNQNNSHKNRINDEYQKLADLRPKLGNEYYLAALRKENVEKNRTLNILAADKYRPFLSTYVAGTTDYINGVVIPSRNNKMGYIMSQLPLRNTITDFWRLVYDHCSCLIVTLNALDEDQEDACAWWPSLGDTVTFGPLVVETLAVETPREEVTERTFRILRKGVKDSKMVYMITYNYWLPGKSLPQSIESFLVLHGRVSTYRKSFPDYPITVLCLDGVCCGGVFVTVSNILDQLVQDGECDVYNAARQVMIRRPQVIKDREQYFFIYQAIYSYIESTTAVYGNM